ncbi:putative transport and Golgi organisation 2 [Lyophyllum shimeji]|uniref:Transport and Golgi organisation 2 n=1 Tax=Lyophyllum shimeji TaxID=47721 RepID=A0A9P3PLU3_LYOSH|nr:putative transport and Golgi organisation 2 [Lyophyllum shimeji]
MPDSHWLASSCSHFFLVLSRQASNHCYRYTSGTFAVVESRGSSPYFSWTAAAMCIALWALDSHDYALILCSNRDEFLVRPTRDAHFHNFEKESGGARGNVLSGLDIKAGGTWFGVSRTGKVALLTNITEPVKPYNFSRGYLASSFLLSDSTGPLEDQVAQIVPQDAQFAGFNLLLFAPAAPRPDGLLHFDSLLVTNHGSGGIVTSRPLSADERFCGCVSNAVDGLNTGWPKVKHATREFDAVLQTLSSETTDADLTDRLFELLAWQSPEPVTERSQLRNTVHVAPLPITLDGVPTLDCNTYATRLSTILLIKKNGNAVFIERDIWQLVDGKAVRADPRSQRIFRFQVEAR